MKKAILTFLLGSLALVPVYEMEGEKIRVGEDKQVEATITVDDNNRVTGYVEDSSPNRFFPERRKVKGEWKSNGVVEVRDKYGYKYNLKPEGNKRNGERRTHNYDYRTNSKKDKSYSTRRTHGKHL